MPDTAKRTLTQLRDDGLSAARALHDGLPIFDGWRHVGKAPSGDPVYEPLPVHHCGACGLDFHVVPGPPSRTHMPDGRVLCDACALAEGVEQAF